MFSISLHVDAQNDLRALAVTCRGAAGKILAMLEQIKADPNLLDALTVDKFGEDDDEVISIRRWVAQHEMGHNLWRMKIWGLEENGQRYRILYAFDTSNHKLHVLAVVKRSEFNYENDHHITVRVLEAYRQLGIPTH